MKEKIKTFVDHNNLSIIIGVFLSILTILAFNRNWINSGSQRFALVMGMLTAASIGISFVPKCRGLFIFVVTLIFLSFTHIFF